MRGMNFNIVTTMKKIISIFVLVAAAAMALTSCQRQEVQEPTPQEYSYTFTLSSETKAVLGDDCVVWESGDQIGVYTDGQKGVSYNRYGNVTPGSPVTFTISSYYALLAGDMVHCYYPYVQTNSKDPRTVEMTIVTSQTEENQMPMVSLPYAVTANLAEKTNSDKSAGEIKFANLGSVIEFNIYSTTEAYQSELVKSVAFNADQPLAGNFTFDLTSVDYSDEATLKISGYEATSVVSTLSTSTKVSADKNAATVVKMVVAPGSYTGNIVVTTDKATYTYPISTAKEFRRSVVKPLGLNLREDVRQEMADVWTLVTSVDNMPDGEYVILAKHTSATGYGYLPSTTTSSAPKYTQQTVFDAVTSVVAPESVPSDMIWNFAQSSGKWIITSPEGKYFYGTADNNGLRVGTTEDTWTITTNAYNSAAFTMKGTKSSRYVGVYNNSDWRSYNTANANNYGTTANGYQNAQLFLYYHGAITIKPGVTVSDVEVSARGGENFGLDYALVNPDGSSVNAEPDGEIVTAATVDGNKIIYTVAPNMTNDVRNGSITITYGEVEKVVKVVQAAPVFTSTVQEIVLDAVKDSEKSLTITSDFDWTAVLSEGAGFTVSPKSYEWSGNGKQEVKITASAANNSEGIADLGSVTLKSEAGAEIVVTVKQETSYVAEGTKTATLSFADKTQRTSYTTTQQVWKQNGITFTNNKSASTNNIGDYADPVRCYASSSITVEMDSNMSEIEFECASSSHATALKNSIGSTATVTVNGSVVTVTLDPSSKSFDVAKLTAQVQLESITVTYTDGTSGGETPEQPETPAAPVLAVTEKPTSDIAAEGDVVTVKYSVTNPVDGQSVTASADVDWVSDFNYSAGEVSFSVDENTGAERTATVTLAYEGATSQTVTIIQTAAQSGAQPTEPITITLDLSKNLFNLSTSKANGASSEVSKTYEGYTYKFKATDSFYYYSSKAMLLGKANSYITFPAISGYKLASVQAHNCSGASAKGSIVICGTSNSTAVSGGTASTIAAGGSKTWTLSSTAANTSYRFYITNAYAVQLTKLVLTYQPAN